MTAVGQATAHESGAAHARGTALYIDDVALPANALHVAVGYAPLAHGELASLELDAVARAPGVVDVVTAADIPGDADIGAVYPGDLLLSASAISFHGQALFAVAAVTHRQAMQAARLADINVSPAEPVLSIADAVKQDATLLPSRDWGVTDVQIESPHVVQGCLHIGGQEHFYLEGQAAYAEPRDDGGVTVHSSTQHPDDVQHQVAGVLALPLHKVDVVCLRMGGGFGGKETQAAPLACLAAWFALRQQRPVKYRMSRADDMIQTGKRHPFEWHYRIGFNDDGVLQHGDIELQANCGHSVDLSSGIVDRALFHATNAYAFEAVRLRAHHRRLNHVSHTAFRGFGGPQGMLGIEAVMDEIAAQTGLDPLEVRKRNLYRTGRDTAPYGQVMEQFSLGDMLKQLEGSCDYQVRQQQIREFNSAHTEFKRGLALTPVQFGISFTTTHLNQAGALVHVFRDGTVQVNHGGTEMGQGLHTKVRQIVATAFGIGVADVLNTPSRTDKVPNASPTAASSGTDMNGFAALNACNKIKDALRKHLAQEHEVVPSQVRFEHGLVLVGDQQFTFAQACDLAHKGRIPLSATGFYATPDIHFDKSRGVGHPFYYFAYGAAASEVVIDCRTGEYRLLRVDVLHDVGNSINPAVDRGQIEGGYIQGLGWLTCEELYWNEQGVLMTDTPANYKIPTADMCPPVFNVDFYQQPNCKNTVHRSKAVGEPPLMLAISAWCALRQACRAAGHRLPYLAAPATPEAVYWAVQEARRP
ncbi:MAG: xanthine dehydrogenase molybdopterin binding subunit [Pseudomonadota bacterium]